MDFDRYQVKVKYHNICRDFKHILYGKSAMAYQGGDKTVAGVINI